MSIGVTAEIKSKIDIVELIGESVQLKKAGTTYKGLCPFHGERTPSFVVTPARESWHCFGCGLGGDVFSFVMQREGIDFPEALRRLAARAGVELDARTTREDARRKRLRDAMESAVAFYHQVLTNSRHGQRALDYLRGRGFTDATIETFQLGYAPEAWDSLSRALTEKRGYREEDLETVGLALRGQRGKVYDRFRGRVIFPIRDASGNATGLGGRILPEPAGPGADGTAAGNGIAAGNWLAAGSQVSAVAPVGAQPAATAGRTGSRDRGPKYLNSPATPLFDKSRTLYLIDRARSAMRRSKQAVIVEGYTDALMAHQAGFANVVAGLGTALTAGQVELVSRYAPSVALAYDVDPAGQHAGTFGATELSSLIGEIQRSSAGVALTDVGVVRLPEGKDPDEVIRDDPSVWERAVAEPQPIMAYLIDHHAQRHDPRTVQGRTRLVAALLPALRRVTDPVERAGYVQLLASRSGADERDIREALARPDTGAGRTRGDVQEPGGRINLEAVLAARDVVDPEAAMHALDPIEQTLLRLLLLYPEQQVRLRDALRPDDLLTTPAREVWRAILADRSADPSGAFARDRFLQALDPELGAIARGLYARQDVPVGERLLEQGVDQCLVRLEQRHLAEHVEYVRAELAEAEARRDQAAREQLRAQIRALEAQRADLDRRVDAVSLLRRRRAATNTTAATNDAAATNAAAATDGAAVANRTTADQGAGTNHTTKSGAAAPSADAPDPSQLPADPNPAAQSAGEWSAPRNP